MIIDCHGHYAIEPAKLHAFRDRQLAALADPARTAHRDPGITDDEIRKSLADAQLKLQCARGADLPLCSPRAAGMAQHVGTAQTGAAWARACNDLTHHVCTLYPQNFVGVCQLPQSPGVPPANCIGALRRCVLDLGFVGCNLNPDPSGGYWRDPPLTDRWWYPLHGAIRPA